MEWFHLDFTELSKARELGQCESGLRMQLSKLLTPFCSWHLEELCVTCGEGRLRTGRYSSTARFLVMTPVFFVHRCFSLATSARCPAFLVFGAARSSKVFTWISHDFSDVSACAASSLDSTPKRQKKPAISVRAHCRREGAAACHRAADGPGLGIARIVSG